MDLVSLRVIFCDRCKCIQANMQSDIGNLHTLDLQLLQQTRREVEPGRGRGGGAWLACIDGLIAFGVIQLFMNIWREWNIPYVGKIRLYGFRKFYQSL